MLTRYFSRVKINVYRVGYDWLQFLAHHGGSAKYQTCFIFYQPTLTLYLDIGSAHLVTVLLWISMIYWLNFPSYPIPSCVEELPALS